MQNNIHKDCWCHMEDKSDFFSLFSLAWTKQNAAARPTANDLCWNAWHMWIKWWLPCFVILLNVIVFSFTDAKVFACKLHEKIGHGAYWRLVLKQTSLGCSSNLIIIDEFVHCNDYVSMHVMLNSSVLFHRSFITFCIFYFKCINCDAISEG